MYLISIVVPVYNSELYLKQTIKSCINQSIGFENIELILVDDCSSDNSRSIIIEYSKKYENIIAHLSDINHGLPGFGRNWGINNSSADYILFLDNDDILDEKICEKLYKVIIDESADICCCNRVIWDGKNKVVYTRGLEDNSLSIFLDDDVLNFGNILLHGKLYKKQLLLDNNIQFTEELAAEDFIFNTECFIHAKKLIVLNNYQGYFWRKLTDSLSHSSDKYVLGYIDASYYVLDLLKNKNKENIVHYIFKWTPRNVLRDCININDLKKDVLICLYDFEKELNFKIDKDMFWIDFINFFVIHRYFSIALFLIKLVRKLVNNRGMLKIIRKIMD